MIPLPEPPLPMRLSLAERLDPSGAWIDWESRTGPRKTFVDDLRDWAKVNQSGRCAFCLLSITPTARREADLDHVVPKASGKYPEWTYEALNLVLACSWCNRRIKKAEDFLVPPKPHVDKYREVALRIVHPYLDQRREAHFIGGYLGGTRRPSFIRDASPRGAATIDFFKLGTHEHLEMWRQEHRGEVRRQRRNALSGAMKIRLAAMLKELGVRR